MKRTVIRITVTDTSAVGDAYRSVAYAWNSASRGAEAAIRTIARGEGQTYSRVADSRQGTVGQWMTYRWQGDRDRP